MYRKLFFSLMLTSAVFLAGSAAAIAQSTSPVRGVVKLKKADGTMVPVADAIIDVYRTDIAKGSPPSSKTNKKGEFSFVGFPFVQTFALAVSGAGIGPKIEPGVWLGSGLSFRTFFRSRFGFGRSRRGLVGR